MKDYTQLNGLALAYVGDAIYEIYVRDYLVEQGETKPNKLHRAATSYVSANAQAYLIKKMLEEQLRKSTTVEEEMPKVTQVRKMQILLLIGLQQVLKH